MNKSIGVLKTAIKNIINKIGIKLFKVNVPLGVTKDNNTVLSCKSGGLSEIGIEMKNNLQKLSDYFNEEQIVNTNIHILVQLPTVATGESKI